MKTQALLVAHDPVYRGWLADCLGDDVAVLPADAEQGPALVEEIQSTPGVGLLFIQFDAEQASERARMLEQVLASFPDLPVVAIGDSEQSQAVLAAMRAGARDYFVLNRDDDNLAALVARVLKRSPAESGGAGRDGAANGKLYAVLSNAGMANVPFLATHIAMALQKTLDDSGRTLLVDISAPGGAVLVFLDVEQNYSALDALDDLFRCDQTLVDTAFSRYDDSIFVLSLPEDRVGPPAMEPDDFARLLDTFRALFDYVVVAADGGIGLGAMNALVHRAHKSLMVTDQSVLRSRQNKHLLHALRQSDCPLDRMGLVIDQYKPNLGLDAQRMAGLLELELFATLSGKARARIEAMNAGEPLFESAPRDAYCGEVRDLVARLTGRSIEAEPAAGGGLFARFRK